ncbi:MAG: hypothetical protein GY827_04845 [Cytophagales bacterium]|nr:hypothetical protein [Cytophagales bacterium]
MNNTIYNYIVIDLDSNLFNGIVAITCECGNGMIEVITQTGRKGFFTKDQIKRR